MVIIVGNGDLISQSRDSWLRKRGTNKVAIPFDLVDMLSKTSEKEILPIKAKSSKVTTRGTHYAMSIQ